MEQQQMAEAEAEAEALLRSIRQLWDEPDHFASAGQWCAILERYFVDAEAEDDLIFYVLEEDALGSSTDSAGSAGSKKQDKSSRIQVFRRGGTRSLPKTESREVNWRETVCLNTIMQIVQLTLTTALCKETAAKTLRPVKSDCRTVYASPSYRSMDVKGSGDVITYPNLFFTVDDFDKFFENYCVSPEQTFTVELFARFGVHETVLFTGSIAHSSSKGGLVTEYLTHSRDRRKKGTYAWINRNQDDLVFFNINAPSGSAGYVEMAVAVTESDQQRLYGKTQTNSPQKSSISSSIKESFYSRSSSSSSFEQQEDKGGFFSTLWSRASYKQLTQTVKSTFRSPYNQDSLKDVHFNTFLTYISLKWSDVMEALLTTPRPARLHKLHLALEKRKDTLYRDKIAPAIASKQAS